MVTRQGVRGVAALSQPLHCGPPSRESDLVHVVEGCRTIHKASISKTDLFRPSLSGIDPLGNPWCVTLIPARPSTHVRLSAHLIPSHLGLWLLVGIVDIFSIRVFPSVARCSSYKQSTSSIQHHFVAYSTLKGYQFSGLAQFLNTIVDTARDKLLSLAF